MKHTFFRTVLIVLCMMVLPAQVHAADPVYTFTCATGGCTHTPGPFLLEPYMEPGGTYTHSFILQNNLPDACGVSLRAIDTGHMPDAFASYLSSAISANGTLYAGSLMPDDSADQTTTLEDLFGGSWITLGSVPAGTSTVYDWTTTMTPEIPNSFQGAHAAFAISLNLSCGVQTTVSSTTEVSSGTTGTVCTDTAPASAPILTSAVAGVNSVTLTWSPAADPVTYYLVAYGTSSGTYLYGNPDVGGNTATSYTVTNLSGGTPYYFTVRAGNGCAPGPFSNEEVATPGGGTVSESPEIAKRSCPGGTPGNLQ